MTGVRLVFVGVITALNGLLVWTVLQPPVLRLVRCTADGKTAHRILWKGGPAKYVCVDPTGAVVDATDPPLGAGIAPEAAEHADRTITVSEDRTEWTFDEHSGVQRICVPEGCRSLQDVRAWIAAKEVR